MHQQSATIDIRLLGAADGHVLDTVAADVFDRPIDARWAREFLADDRHHLVVALEGDVVVGFASAVHYVHPDKGPELWINEVGVAPTHQGRGIGRQLMSMALELAQARGLRTATATLLAENVPMRRLVQRANRSIVADHLDAGVEEITMSLVPAA